jgi:hypothetical protein
MDSPPVPEQAHGGDQRRPFGVGKDRRPQSYPPRTILVTNKAVAPSATVMF